MTKNKENIKDWRSTGRREARRTLFRSRIDFKCINCGVTSIEPPKDAPSWFEEIWPEENRALDYSLQADHEAKDYKVNDVEHLNWRCQPCHKAHDSLTGKGESTVEIEFF